MTDADFIAAARTTYAAANAGTLRWMLARPALHGVYLNTKLNSITLADYGVADGVRGPDFTYGWIQGRGLEPGRLGQSIACATEPLVHGVSLDSARHEGRRPQGDRGG